MARYVDRRSKCFQTALGELTLERAYYYCSRCQSGFCPRDRALGLDGFLSPAVVRMLGAVGATVRFEEGRGLFKELAGLHIGAKLVQYLAGAETYGQILLGLSRPCADLSRGATEDDILGVAAILGLQAIEYRKLYPPTGEA